MDGCAAFLAWLSSVVPGGFCCVPRACPEWFAVAEVTRGSRDLLLAGWGAQVFPDTAQHQPKESITQCVDRQ